MLETTQQALTLAGSFCAMGFAAIGSAYGCGVAGAAAVGGWKKCYVQGKPAPFQLSAFAGAPMTQTIYGMLLMNQIMNKAPEMWAVCLIIGIVCGCAIAASAVFQGRAAAAACDSFSETGQGFANDLMAIGIIEAVAILRCSSEAVLFIVRAFFAMQYFKEQRASTTAQGKVE